MVVAPRVVTAAPKVVAVVAQVLVFLVETGPAQPASLQGVAEVMHHQARLAVKQST